MLFQNKVDRAMKYSQEQKEKRDELLPGEEYDPATDPGTPDIGDNMEKGDLAAMILAALVTFLPLIGILLLLAAIAAWMMIVM